MTNFDRLTYLIKERDGIRQKKELGLPKPWTKDHILQQYRFCNVRRMDDKVSRWLMEQWYSIHCDHPNMLAACALARHFNLPSALGTITEDVFVVGPPLWESIKVKMRKRKSKGKTIFNGAYMVRGIGTADKTEMVVDNVCRPLVDNPPTITGLSMQQAVEALLPYWGFSSFMAGQVVADLRWAMTGTWADRHRWAPIGPGSMRGMNRLQGRNFNFQLKQPQFLDELLDMIVKLKIALPRDLSKRLEAMDYQNCLCEFDKYERTRLGEGHPKQRYPGLS